MKKIRELDKLLVKAWHLCGDIMNDAVSDVAGLGPNEPITAATEAAFEAATSHPIPATLVEVLVSLEEGPASKLNDLIKAHNRK